MTSLSRRLDALEAMTQPDALPVDAVHFVGLSPDGVTRNTITRATFLGSTYTRESDEAEDAFMARVRAARPAGDRSLIMCF